MLRSTAGTSRAWPFLAVGTACVVAGGLVAAVTATAPSELGAWAAAYLVLVGGVAQVGLGLGQAALAAREPSTGLVATECALWNAGNTAVLLGTIFAVPLLVDAGGALLVATLVLLLRGVHGRDGPARNDRDRRWIRYGFRILVLILAVSIPIGLALAA
ncbi:MAG: hypothetical protein ACRDO8_09280 [Nocardioidaceae bacterium]